MAVLDVFHCMHGLRDVGMNGIYAVMQCSL